MRRMVPILILFGCAGRPGTPATSCPESAPADRAAEVAADPAEVARAYLDATAALDLDRAAELVDERAVVFESGGNEGTWSEYRSHHLGPELAEIAAFEIRPGELATRRSADGTLALVTVPIEYDITLKDGRRIESTGTVTFALGLAGGRYRIDHVHWSSRKRQAAHH